MVNEAKILLRSLIETLFSLRAIALDAKMADRYFDNHIISRYKGLKQIKDYCEEARETPAYYDSAVVNERLDELKKRIKSTKSSPLTTKQLAQKAQLLDFYRTAYGVLCWTAHSNVIDIGQYLRGDSDDDIKALEWHPEATGVDAILMSSIECAVIALKSINKLFRLDENRKINSYYKKYVALNKKKPVGKLSQ